MVLSIMDGGICIIMEAVRSDDPCEIAGVGVVLHEHLQIGCENRAVPERTSS